MAESSKISWTDPDYRDLPAPRQKGDRNSPCAILGNGDHPIEDELNCQAEAWADLIYEAYRWDQKEPSAAASK